MANPRLIPRNRESFPMPIKATAYILARTHKYTLVEIQERLMKLYPKYAVNLECIDRWKSQAKVGKFAHLAHDEAFLEWSFAQLKKQAYQILSAMEPGSTEEVDPRTKVNLWKMYIQIHRAVKENCTEMKQEAIEEDINYLPKWEEELQS